MGVVGGSRAGQRYFVPVRLLGRPGSVMTPVHGSIPGVDTPPSLPTIHKSLFNQFFVNPCRADTELYNCPALTVRCHRIDLGQVEEAPRGEGLPPGAPQIIPTRLIENSGRPSPRGATTQAKGPRTCSVGFAFDGCSCRNSLS